MSEARSPAAKGTYVLVTELARQESIIVGKLGSFACSRGYYVYVGSALGSGGLAARLARHQRRQKRLHWHIDYLLQHAKIIKIGSLASPTRLECEWARAISSLPRAQVLLPRFGASDCRCSAHLIYFAENPIRVIASLLPEIEWERHEA